MKLRFAALLVGFSCAIALPAAAASPALDDARKLTAKASVEYDVGHFDQALDLYTKAYERYPKPALLFDIGQCHRLLGHYERAIFFYQGYLRGKPEAANRALVEQFILDSQKQLDAQRAAGPVSPPASEATPPPPPAAAPAPAPSDASASPPASNDTLAQRPDSTSAPTSAPTAWPLLRIAGVATAGVGVVLLGVAIGEGLQASSLSNQVSQISSQHGTWSPQAQSDYDSGKSAATAANVLYVTGALVLAGGAVMTWLGWPKTPSTTAAVAPLPGGASMSLVTRF
jgi:tetratricopeptide (TPR) repeat protein